MLNGGLECWMRQADEDIEHVKNLPSEWGSIGYFGAAPKRGLKSRAKDKTIFRIWLLNIQMCIIVKPDCLTMSYAS